MGTCIQHWYGLLDCRAFLGEPGIKISTCSDFVIVQPSRTQIRGIWVGGRAGRTFSLLSWLWYFCNEEIHVFCYKIIVATNNLGGGFLGVGKQGKRLPCFPSCGISEI